MWKVVKVCLKCLGGEFNKNEYGDFICIECDEIYEDMDELQNMDIEE